MKDCPNFLNFVGDNTVCDIIYQSTVHLDNPGHVYDSYPFYLQKLKIEF